MKTVFPRQTVISFSISVAEVRLELCYLRSKSSNVYLMDSFPSFINLMELEYPRCLLKITGIKFYYLIDIIQGFIDTFSSSSGWSSAYNPDLSIILINCLFNVELLNFLKSNIFAKRAASLSKFDSLEESLFCEMKMKESFQASLLQLAIHCKDTMLIL